MNEQQLAAVKQALAALEKSLPRLAPDGEQDWLDSCKAITALQSIIDQATPPAVPVQEPCRDCAGEGIQGEEGDGFVSGVTWRCGSCNGTGKSTPPAPQPVPVKTYHDAKPWPVQPTPANPFYFSDERALDQQIQSLGKEE